MDGTNQLKSGFCRLVVTPPLGLEIPGYFSKRISDGILDDLCVTALAVSDGENKAVLFSADFIGIVTDAYLEARKIIAERCGIPEEAVYIACTHSHTAYRVSRIETKDSLHNTYLEFLYHKMADAAQFAFEDLKDSKLSIARGSAPGISFIRRYVMKDGITRTNPGKGNPDVVRPVQEADDTVQLLKFEREGGKDIALVNFQTHPDVIGGTKYSADWPYFVRDTVEKALGVNCIFFNGAQGDSNHVDVFLPKDSKTKGYGHAQHMGRAIAGEVLKIYDKTTPIFSDKVDFVHRAIEAPAFCPTAEQREEAKRVIELDAQGRKEEIIATGMKGTWYTSYIPLCKRLVKLPEEQTYQTLHLVSIRIGDFAITSIPGEPFTSIGTEIKNASNFDMTVVTCCSNGSQGYFPNKAAFNEGGYEVFNSRFSSEIPDILISNSVEMLEELKNRQV